MTRVRNLLLGVWDFIVGDDWPTALGVVVAIAITALVAHQTRIAAWWVLPVAVSLLLWISVRRAAR
jgi:hypothetical protein